MDLSKFRTNLNLEEDGVWIDIDEKSRIKIARLGNPKYKKVFRRESQPYRIQIKTGNLPDSIADKILINTLAESVLLDWENMEMDGKPIKYSKQAAIDILSNPQLKDFRNFVAEMADTAELFYQQQQAESEKNSPSSPSGGQS